MTATRTWALARRHARRTEAVATWLYDWARRHRQRLLVAAAALGTLFMVLHWR